MASIFILENSLDVLFARCQDSGNIIRANELFREYVSHIKPVNILDVVVDSDKDEFKIAVDKARKSTPLPCRTYARTRQKNGAERYSVWNVYSIDDHLYFIGVQLFDVNSVESYEHERLKSLLSDAEFIVSHEIRQPLSALLGLFNLIDSEDLPAEHAELVKMIQKSADELDKNVARFVKKLSRHTL